MQHVEIDFDVYKSLTSLRQNEQMTYNDVLRDLLKLPAQPKTAPAPVNGMNPWVVAGTSFPVGSEFIAEHKSKTYTGSVKDGKLELSDGHGFPTPSAAAVYVTGTNVNGWRFWRCRLPGSSEFVPIERLRGKAH